MSFAVSRARAVVPGIVGGMLGGLVMNTYARAISAATGGHEARGAAPGWDRHGRGMQPPQAMGAAEEDAAVQVGASAYRVVTGRDAPVEARRRLGVLAHYGFSASVGMAYVMLARQWPLVRRGWGVPFGVLVWAVADEGVTPALHLSRGPQHLSSGVHAFSLTGHCLYGAALEATLRMSEDTAAKGRSHRR